MIGAATKSYLMQRVTGAVMIPISIWILFYLLPNIGTLIFSDSNLGGSVLKEIFIRVDHITYIVIFIICGIYHGILGMQSVIHDYIHCSVMKKIITTVVYGCAIFAMVFLSVFSVNMHLRAINEEKINEVKL